MRSSATQTALGALMNTSESLGAILLVEDELLVRDEIAGVLRIAGWDVLEVNSGERAVALLRSGQHIDVIFTDIQLAGALNGWDVAEHGRATQAAMPVIYTSGNSVDRSRKHPRQPVLREALRCF